MPSSRLRAAPLARFERDGLKAALKKAGLPNDDIEEPGLLFWRFETQDDVPVGFGGLEIYNGSVEIDDEVPVDFAGLGISGREASPEIFGRDALLRSIVILPPLRGKGFGAAIVTTLELEARLLGCRAIYLLTMDASLFIGLGYRNCERNDVPSAIAARKQFRSVSPAAAAAMVKRIV